MTQPVADDAAVAALVTAMTCYPDRPTWKGAAERALSAIRAGKVPGVWCYNYAEPVKDEPPGEAYWRERCREQQSYHHEKHAEIAALRAELAAERERAEALNLESIDRGQEAYDAEQERDTARARCAVLEGLLRRYADRMNAVNGDVGPACIAELRLDIDAVLAGEDKP